MRAWVSRPCRTSRLHGVSLLPPHESNFCPKRTSKLLIPVISALKVTKPGTRAGGAWEDEYSLLGDRIDAPPLALPPVRQPVHVFIVRHGESTWNAESRIQGSSDFSELTPKGKQQAEAARAMLQDVQFDRVYASTLTRAKQTADIVMAGGRPQGGSLPVRLDLPVLREIDLYSFQGLTKEEAKVLFPEERRRWKEDPQGFEIDGHAPCRELWHRASLAWRQILEPEAATQAATLASVQSPVQSADVRKILVVAHNNTNQALVATALGLPCSYLHRQAQSNGGVTTMVLTPSSGAVLGSSNIADLRLSE